MMKPLSLFALLSLGQVLFAQSYDVDVPEPFRTPDYLAMDPSGDYSGFTPKFWTELQRAGFNVINNLQATNLRRPPKPKLNEKEVVVDIYQVLSNALKVDPNIMPLKKRKLTKYLRQSGIGTGVELGIEEGIRQGIFVALPGKMIAMNPDAQPPTQPVNTEAPWTPPQIYTFTYNYTYRTSLRCGSTATELRAAINDLETGETMCTMRFEQPSLAGRCPSDIAHELVRRLKNASHYDLDVNLGANPKAVHTIATVGESGTDCDGTKSDSWVSRLGAELLGEYTLVNREELDHLIEEQRKDMTAGAFEGSDLIEAGKLIGAEALLFGTIKCSGGKTVADVKLVNTSTGESMWTAHGENVSPEITAKYVIHELNAIQ